MTGIKATELRRSQKFLDKLKKPKLANNINIVEREKSRLNTQLAKLMFVFLKSVMQFTIKLSTLWE